MKLKFKVGCCVMVRLRLARCCWMVEVRFHDDSRMNSIFTMKILPLKRQLVVFDHMWLTFTVATAITLTTTFFADK